MVVDLPLFPIPISLYNFGEDNHELNVDLVTDILKEQDRDPDGLTQSNLGGWHSSSGLEDRYESFSALKKQIEDSANDYCVKHGYLSGLVCQQLWANVNQNGDMTVGHHHGVSALTGVYYPVQSIVDNDCNFSYSDTNPIQAGIWDGKKGGSIYFQDPSYGLKTGLRKDDSPSAYNLDAYYTYPVAGLLIVFPSYLTHAVLPFREEQTKRLSISFTAVYR
mgnify:FL=1|jgi:hypothetical protein|tara:strand:- start:433 stop:1092 length:660 start_codon:yes stop_codon:yes gene_type:complete